MISGMSEPVDLRDDMSEGGEGPATETPLVQLPNSAITAERFPDGLTITVPPAGLWRGTAGLFPFAIIWNGFMIVFTPGLLLGTLGGKDFQQTAAIVVPAVLALFWLVGIGLLLGALNMGRRQAAIAVTAG